MVFAMNQVQPTFETIFRDEYWGEVPPMAEPIKSRGMKAFNEQRARFGSSYNRFPREVASEANELLCFAADKVIANEPLMRVEDGEQIGGPDDNQYAIPGAVLLVDRESVDSAARNVIFQRGKPFEAEAELERSAVSAFLSGMVKTDFGRFSREKVYKSMSGGALMYALVGRSLDRLMPREELEDYPILTPYRGHYLSPAKEGLYERTVDLFAFLPTKEGHTGSVRFRQWGNPLNGNTYADSIVTSSKVLAQWGFWPDGRVGETVNLSQASDRREYARIKEAYLCMPGSLERAMAMEPVSQKSSVPVGELATDKP